MKRSPIMALLRGGGLPTALIIFFVVLVMLLGGVFKPGQTLFSNDGPLGELMAQCHRLPDRFWGCWLDLNNIGFNGGAAAPSISFALQWLLGPFWFSKLYALLSLLILGLGAWCFFRQLKLSAPACLLGGLAAMLNSTFFSVACWGVGAHDITAGMIFLALAAVADPAAPQRWLRVILAGLALGMAVTEGADVGAIYSFFAAAFILYQSWTMAGSRLKAAAGSVLRLALVAACAAFLAAQSMHGLVNTSIRGVKGTEQDAQTKAERWDWATQWSLPKSELLNLVIPGIYGYRMDDLNEQIYWGKMGRAPAVEKYLENGRQGPQPKGFLRYSGGGNYDGCLVFLLALWAIADSLRRKTSVFATAERKWIWFWAAAAAVSLLLALGRFAPFYKFVYALPYFSTIRNPVKFIYPFSLALVVLFAYGAHGLYRYYMQATVPGAPSRWAGLPAWWTRAARFEKIWTWVCGILAAAVLVGWWQYAAHRSDLVQFLSGAEIAASPEAVADFSIQHAGWLPIVFILGAGLMALTFSRAFGGRRATAGAVCFGVLLVADLGLANYPWVHYWNYPEKYATNAIIDILRDKPYERRVGIVPLETSREFASCYKLYKLEWAQHEFPYHNIQSFETVEMSRMPNDYAAFSAAVNATNGPGTWFHLLRAWQLTATGYVIAPVGLADFLARQHYFAQPPLELVTQFKIEAKPGIAVARRPDEATAVPANNGPFALFRFASALPRVMLYPVWEVNTNDTNVLAQVADGPFDPLKNVLVDEGLTAGSVGATNLAPVPATIVSYAPKDIVIKADAPAPSILMLADHYDPNWKVFVDGRPETLLRCDFIFRGVRLAAGPHQVEFKFLPPTGWLGVSVAAVGVGLVIISLLSVRLFQPGTATPSAEPAPMPPAVPPAGHARLKTAQDGKKAGGKSAARR